MFGDDLYVVFNREMHAKKYGMYEKVIFEVFEV